jgi:NhaC family Na+:H+ antiporter
MKSNINLPLPSPLVSLIPIAALVAMLAVTIHLFGSDALGGGSQICLLTATAICALIGMSGYKRRWKHFEKAITKNISGVGTALIILLIIGALSGAWMISGVVPTLIYYGIQIIHPSFFLVCTCLICSIVSVMTGSSWTTIATIGIALMGIGEAQGFDPGWTAGAIISGAYFGDKVSPLSDTTVLAASVTDVPLFSHIRYLMFTTVPSLIITLIIFTIAGLSHEAADTTHIALFCETLANKFHISGWLMIVPIVTAIMIAKKVPSLITLFLSTALATIFAIIFQPELLVELAGDAGSYTLTLIKGALSILFGSTSLETGNAEINDLIATRGMSGMLDTIWAIVLPGAFGVYNMIIARTYYQGIPRDLQEAAEIDGANEMVYFFRVLLPVCTPIIATIAMWNFVGMWNSYFDAMIYLNSASKQPLQLVLRSILIQNQPEPGMVSDMQSTAQRAQLAELLKYATIIISSIPLLIMYPFFQRYFDSGIMAGAVKG